MELNKETFTIEDLKQLLKEAFEFDYDKHKGKVKFLPLTIVEWHKSDIQRYTLHSYSIKGRISHRYKPFLYIGEYFDSIRTIVIFLNRTETISLAEHYNLSLPNTIAYFIISLYHELKHSYESLSDVLPSENEEMNELEIFKLEICDFVNRYNPQFYREYHDGFLTEIICDLYGVRRAFEFFKSKGMLTQEVEEYLKEKESQYLLHLNNFDLHYFLRTIDKTIKENKRISNYNYWFLMMFYNYDNSFKTIDEILKENKRFRVNDEILNYFFSSVDFLNSLDFNTLSLENKQIIIKAIDFTLKIEINRRKKNKEFLQNNAISPREYLNIDAGICSKIAYYHKKLEQINRTMKNTDISDLENKRR